MVVAAFAADPDRVPQWYRNITSVEWKTPRPLTIGSRIAFIERFLGRGLAYTYEVAEWVPNERFVMRTADGPFPMETTCTWEDAGRAATSMTLRNRGTPRGFSIWLAPLMGMAVQRANRKDLAALKMVLESSRS
jgi:Polyketide cyclase / dehydrase and lipid transport